MADVRVAERRRKYTKEINDDALCAATKSPAPNQYVMEITHGDSRTSVMSRFDARRFTLWRPMWWQLTLLAALAIAVVLAFAIVATSLALIIAPIALMAVFAHRFFGRRAAPRRNAHSS